MGLPFAADRVYNCNWEKALSGYNLVLIEIEKLSELEQKHQWNDAVILLQNLWNKNRNNEDLLLRLATECWYLITNWDLLDLEHANLRFEDIQSILIETYNFLIEHHSGSNKIIAIFGYMISLFPNYFYTDFDQNGKLFLQFEKIGKEMLHQAYLNGAQPLYEILYLGSIHKVKANSSEQALKLNVRELFPGDTAVEQYFREVLLRYSEVL